MKNMEGNYATTESGNGSAEKFLQRFSGWLTQIFPHMRSKPIQNRGFEWVLCARVKILCQPT